MCAYLSFSYVTDPEPNKQPPLQQPLVEAVDNAMPCHTTHLATHILIHSFAAYHTCATPCYKLEHLSPAFLHDAKGTQY